jgi:hypothetical protein
MDVAQFKAYVTCTATVDRDQVPSLLNSNGFTYPLLIYSNTNPILIIKVNPANQGSQITFFLNYSL